MASVACRAASSPTTSFRLAANVRGQLIQPSQLGQPSRLTPSRIDCRRAFSAHPALRQPQSAPKFTYYVASSFHAKKSQGFDWVGNVFSFNPYQRIQTEKKRPESQRPASGQDAFFVSRVGGSNGVAFGVADGVGGWMESGVDSAHFAHTLCDYMASAAYAHNTDSSKAPLAPRALMQQGYDEICEDRDIKAGGSTACVAVASEDGKLEVANLGDSGFIHIRLNAVYSHSEPQTHAFNTPYQLSIVPRSMLARAAAFGGAQLCDYPKDADVTHHDLQPGDVIIMASDGVWDNLFTHELLQTVSQYMRKSGAWKKGKDGLRVSGDVWRHIELDYNAKRPYTLPSAIASEIAGAARAASMNTRRDGPFAKEVQRNYPSENWRGGKLDDICVVVVVVSDNRRETDPIESKL